MWIIILHCVHYFRRVRKILKSDCLLLHVCQPTCNNWASTWTVLHGILHLGIFREPVKQIQVSLKSDKNDATSHEGQYMLLIISRSVLLTMKTISGKFVQKIKTHIVRSILFFFKSCRLWDDVKKYCIAGQATDDNKAHAHCMLDT